MSQSSLFDNALNSLNSLRRKTSLRENLRLLRSSSKDSLKSNKSSNKRLSSYCPYTVYEQTMFPVILRDPDATNKLLEAILDSPNGKRSLSRLARTCRALSEPALNILWRDLDSLVPIIGLFPGYLLKKTRKPGMGLSRLPRDEDWKSVIKYGERIRRVAYDEGANNMAPSIFSILDERRPKALTYILPRLQELTWKVETPAALERCMIFFSPELQFINLEVGSKFPQLSAFLTDMSSRINLKGFSFISPTSLPDAFTELLKRHEDLEKVVLVAPGALASGVGRWVASLRHLKHLQLDLTGRSPIAVEGFFDELRPRSGDSTPNSIISRDSGVFSGEELDFTEIRKSMLRLTGDMPSKGSFAKLKRLQLTGDVANIAVFLKHLDSDLIHLDLVIEDPPDNADWQDLSSLMCERFGDTLQSLRITATPSSKFIDLVRSTPRGEPPSGRLSLEHFTDLPNLIRLDIDLPESVVFTPVDIECIARACPNLEMLRLCPLARFPPSHSPKLTLESLTPLTTHCKRLHTLAAVFTAAPASSNVLSSRATISPSLLRLHAGHSWATDSLQISIFLSHLMPRLESLKWFQEKTRAGFIESHAKAWQSVSEILPHLQDLRSTERSFLQQLSVPPKPETSEKGVDATVLTKTCGISARKESADASTQATPALVSREVDAQPKFVSMSVEAIPSTNDVAIEMRPLSVSASIQTSFPSSDHCSSDRPIQAHSHVLKSLQNVYVLSSIFNLISFAYRFAILPVSFSSRILHAALAQSPFRRGDSAVFAEQQKAMPKITESATSPASESIPLDPL